MFTVIIRRGELRDKQKLAFEFFLCRLSDVFIGYFSRYCRSSTRSSAHLKRVPSRTRNAGSCWKRNECRSRGNLEPMIMSTTRDDPPCWHVSRENVIGSESTRPIQSGAGTPWVNHDLTGLAEKRTGLVTLERRRAAEWTIPSVSRPARRVLNHPILVRSGVGTGTCSLFPSSSQEYNRVFSVALLTAQAQ